MWNKDISLAPLGKYEEVTKKIGKSEKTFLQFIPDRVILATKCKKVVLSQWLPEGKERKVARWQMLNEGENPIAWFPWPEYPEDL